MSLVEQLRGVDDPCEHRKAKSCSQCCLVRAYQLTDDAADEIERLHAMRDSVKFTLSAAASTLMLYPNPVLASIVNDLKEGLKLAKGES